MSTRDIISDAEVIKVHGHANFGSFTPRQVVDFGVLQIAFGYSVGATMAAIMREHKLAHKHTRHGYRLYLSERGAKYLRALVAYEDVRDLAGVVP